MKVTRPALRYFGGKFRIAPWIISHFPPHTCYCEPYGGAASVLLVKQPSQFEFYNDIDGEIVNFFRVLRNRGDELIRQIELTPYSREEQEAALIPFGDELERARRFYVRSWQTIVGADHRYRSGWRLLYQSSKNVDVVADWNNTSHLNAIVWRLKQIQIENRPALELIQRVDTPETLFFLDPPYVKSTRSEKHRDVYRFEMDDADHQALANVVNQLQGMVIIAGYDSPLYQDLYPGFQKTFKKTRKNSGVAATECLWLSPSATKSQIQPALSLDWGN